MAEKKFGSRRFKSDPMLATQAMLLQAKLLRLAGPAVSRLGEIMGGYNKDASEAERQRSSVAGIQALTEIFAVNDPEVIMELMKEILETAMIERGNKEYGPVDFDGDFTEHKGDIMPVLVWICQEQFSDFFSGLLALGNQK